MDIPNTKPKRGRPKAGRSKTLPRVRLEAYLALKELSTIRGCSLAEAVELVAINLGRYFTQITTPERLAGIAKSTEEKIAEL
jgi:hypothetical protein